MVLLLTVGVFVYAADEPFEFKGIALGSDFDTVKADKKFDCSDTPKRAGGDQTCFLGGKQETIAGIAVDGMLLSFYGGKLHSISIYFNADNFEHVVDALSQKYGDGDVKTEVVQNRMGATFENHIYSWRRSDETLVATRFTSKLDRSSVVFRTDFSVEEFTRRRNSSINQDSKDL
jgi:hypothetical protein